MFDSLWCVNPGHRRFLCTCLFRAPLWAPPINISAHRRSSLTWESPCTDTRVFMYAALDLLHILYLQECRTRGIIHLCLINGFDVHFQSRTMCVYEFYQSTVINGGSVLC